MGKGSQVVPSFRFKSSWFILGVRVFRWITFLMYGFAIGWINTHTLPPNTISFGGNIKFLTYWNLLVQFALFALINYCDMFLSQVGRSNTNNSKVLIKLRDLVHHGVALPIGSAVALIFWFVYAIDPELMYPVRVRPYYPEWLNHISHTFVGITVWIEELVFEHPRNNRISLFLLFTFLAFYFIWFIYLGYIINHWVYPIIRIIPDLYKLPFILSFGFLFLAIFYLINYTHSALWQQKHRKEKKR